MSSQSSLQTDSVILIFGYQRARASEGWMFRDRGAETAKTTRSQYSVKFKIFNFDLTISYITRDVHSILLVSQLRSRGNLAYSRGHKTKGRF